MRRLRMIMLAFPFLAFHASAGVIVDNGLPQTLGSYGVTGTEYAEPFNLSTNATIVSATFWMYEDTPSLTSLTYSFYYSGPEPTGPVILATTVTPAAQFFYEDSAYLDPQLPGSPIYEIQFNLQSPLALDAGMYWFSLDGISGWAQSGSGFSNPYFTFPEYMAPPGTFQWTVNLESEFDGYTYAFQLSDTAVSAAAPEPATFTLTAAAVAFLGGLGSFLRARQRAA